MQALCAVALTSNILRADKAEGQLHTCYLGIVVLRSKPAGTHATTACIPQPDKRTHQEQSS